MVCIALVAGEASGDLLGAALIRALKKYYPNAEFIGIAGPEMVKEGCVSFYPMEQLSIMGLFEVLKHLPSLLKMRKQLLLQLLQKNPDVFIGIDAPDFNLTLERKLKHAGVKTVHYVSPSIWAWRQWRVRKIAASVDLMLTLFPFEVEFYQKNNIRARFVGHPLASMIPLEPDQLVARKKLGLQSDAKILAILPGSRRAELERLAGLFIKTAIECYRQDSNLQFIVPFATNATQAIFQHELDMQGIELPVTLIRGNSREVMQASDYVLLASGTAALEAMLLKKPMVVSYRMNGLTFWLLKKLKILKLSLYSLPNVLAGKQIVEEYYQQHATQPNLVGAVMRLVTHGKDRDELLDEYKKIHMSLLSGPDNQAADVIAELIEDNNHD